MNSKGPNTDPCGTPQTKCMLFSTNQGNIKPQILFNNEDVEFVVNHKHLGVTFSSNCKWHCHIQNILKSTSGQLSMLRKFYRVHLVMSGIGIHNVSGGRH
jgi:hypothetical protein